MIKLRFTYVIFLAISLTSHAFATRQSSYQEAVINSSLHKPRTAISQLITIQGERVKMVVFTSYDGYKASDTSLGANIWTTVAPDVKQLCEQFAQQNRETLSHQQLALWIAQLLGISADNVDKRRFVELEVPVIQAYYGASPKMIGIFRPCTDPRIGVHTDESPICPKQMNPNDVNISANYKTWFINNSIAAHTLDNGMPWTEYGYTYNWNEHASSTFGVSEFIVLRGTPITVLPNPNNPTTPYISAEEYCGVR